jgi:NADPH:quinone reductase-like Zn-dependent oxidoreductase
MEAARPAMRAIIHERYGSPDLLRVGDVEVPTPGPEQVLVRVRASSVNALDWRRVRADPFLVRFSEGLLRPKTPLIGADAAGVVEAVGANVTDLRPGDEVYGMRTGALAEYVAGKNFVTKPANLSMEEAAAIPIAGVTALQSVRDHGRVTPGDKVLVNGAGGGVGSFAVQIARPDGAEVTAVTRTDKVELMRSIGADHVIDYTREDFTRGGVRYDVVIDPGGNRSVRQLRRILAPGGRLVLVGAGHGPGGALGRLVGGIVRRRLLRQPIAMFMAEARRDDLVTLRDLADAGKVRPLIDRTYPLDQTADALKYLETGSVSGKVVVTV